MSVEGGREINVFLLKKCLWLFFFFGVVGLGQVATAAEDKTQKKALV